MKAIYKYELRSYLHSSVTYVFVGLFYMICALYFFIDNIRGRSGDLTAFYNSVSLLLLFFLPIMTAKVISEDRKSRFEILLITSPVNVSRIVIGKFLAVMTVVTTMLLLTLSFPALLSLFAQIGLPTLLNRYIGLLLLSMAIVALGVFVSSLTENQVAAAIVSLIVLLVLFIAKAIGTAVGGRLADVIASFSIFSRYSEMNDGVLDIGTVVYLVSFTVVFLLLAIQFINLRRIGGIKKGAKIFSAAKIGVILETVLALLLVLLINVNVNIIPIEFDLSEGNFYSIGQETKDLLAALDDSVTVYALFDDGKADSEYKMLESLLRRYVLASDGKLKVEYIDPDKNPNILSELDPNGNRNLAKNNFYITNGEKGVKIAYADLFEVKYDQRTSAWYNTGFKAEQAFTGAISYVGIHDGRVIYVVSDYNTQILPAGYASLWKDLAGKGYQVSDLKIDGKIPSDAAMLVFMAPESDLDQENAQAVRNFLDAGGSVAVFLETVDCLPNLSAILEEYGVRVHGDVLYSFRSDSDGSNAEQRLILSASESKIVPLETYGIVFDGASPLSLLSQEDTEHTILIQTDENAYSSVNGQGEYIVAVAAEKGDGKLCVFGDADFLSEKAGTRKSGILFHGIIRGGKRYGLALHKRRAD